MWYTVALFCLFLFAFTTISFGVGKHFYIRSHKKGITLKNFDTLSVSVFSILLIISGTFFYFLYPELPLYPWIICLGLIGTIFYFSYQKLNIKQNTVLQLALCFLAVFAGILPSFNFSPEYICISIILSLLWWIGWRLFVFFDRYPVVSNVTSSAWTLALLTNCVIFALPSKITIIPLLLGVSVFTVARIRLSSQLLNLGTNTAQLAGFFWAGLWTYCLFKAPLFIFLLIYGYYLIELFIMGRAYFQKKQIEPLFVKTINTPLESSKAIAILFKHIFILSVVAVFLLFIQIQNCFWIAALIFLLISFHLYNNLKHIGCPIGGWRDIFNTTKEALHTLPKFSKNFTKEIKNNLKTQSKKKTSVGKSRSTKRKKKK